MNGNTFRRMATTAVVSAGIAGGLVAGTGLAAAQTVEVPMSTCFGLSPYIVDQPYIASRAFFYQDGPGTGTVTLADVSSVVGFFTTPYLSDARLDWRNKTTGATGTLTATTPIALGNAVNLRMNSGPGEVEITRSAVNRNALWAIPTTSCTGTVRVN
ncbi:hypothetical protein SAMN05444583_10916 [Rhodococcus maanshanensis]|uniref:Uncharacterized protein n=2 Tax=Rhodococcus maanshanensis TaxID=183556 RepID=A0A1H7Q4Q2_9NOCA|nr:hypothetical protein SAMN05444583_10916 [Rhodococcus maanshanensis]